MLYKISAWVKTVRKGNILCGFLILTEFRKFYINLFLYMFRSTRSFYEKIIFIFKIWYSRSYIKKLSWDLRHIRSHPHRSFGVFGIFFIIRLHNLLIIFAMLHIFMAAIMALFYNIQYSGGNINEPLFFHRFYFSIITQISPGFTEFVPSTDSSRLLSIANGLLGLTLNGLFISFLFARAARPFNIFEVVPFMLHSPIRNKIVLRIYSKYPEPIHNLNVKFYRFYIHNNQYKEQMGKTEEIKIIPSERRMLRPYYGLLLTINFNAEAKAWDAKPSPGDIIDKIPYNWFSPTNKADGHFYLIISADTTSGTAHQVVDFFFSEFHIRCGEHILLNHGQRMDVHTWYNYRMYEWDKWGKVSPPNCGKCQFPICTNERDRQEIRNAED